MNLKEEVAIPSNRVNVSYFQQGGFKMGKIINVAIPSNRVNVSYKNNKILPKPSLRQGKVAIPSNRVNVSYSTHLFLRIIGNLTPLLREPHYFYAFLFPI